jgi:hypothetical protein
VVKETGRTHHDTTIVTLVTNSNDDIAANTLKDFASAGNEGINMFRVFRTCAKLKLDPNSAKVNKRQTFFAK